MITLRFQSAVINRSDGKYNSLPFDCGSKEKEKLYSNSTSSEREGVGVEQHVLRLIIELKSFLMILLTGISDILFT
jgi:hypothetical protein